MSNAEKTDNDVRHIYLGQTHWATVDAQDYVYLKHYAWFCEKKRRSWYAYTVIIGKERVYKLYMHRLVAGTPAHMVTHHINRQSLYNCKSNLQNMLRNEHALEHINNPLKVISTQDHTEAV